MALNIFCYGPDLNFLIFLDSNDFQNKVARIERILKKTVKSAQEILSVAIKSGSRKKN